MAYTIFIIDDHPITTEGLSALIAAEDDMEVCGRAHSGEEFLRQLDAINTDLMVVDLSLGEGSGLALISRILEQKPECPILVVSMYDEKLYASRALQAGARGYLMKSEAPSEIIKAIRRLLNGDVYLSKTLSSRILLRYAGKREVEDRSPLEGLSDREVEVFEYMGWGLTTRQIAEKLKLSSKTIDSYRARLKEKLDIDTNARLRREAVMWVEQKRKPSAFDWQQGVEEADRHMP